MWNEQDERLHAKWDVLLLAYEFVKFRNNSFRNYGLCLSDYLSATALSWDAMLNIIKVELEFTSDLYMLTFFKKGMRGGVSHILNRNSKSSNE